MSEHSTHKVFPREKAAAESKRVLALAFYLYVCLAVLRPETLSSIVGPTFLMDWLAVS
jgi:hypothetical protein